MAARIRGDLLLDACLAIIFAGGCATSEMVVGGVPPVPFEAEGEHVGESERAAKASEPTMCRTRWRPPAPTVALGESQSVAYTRAGGCSHGPQVGARTLATYLRAHFGDRIDRSVTGDGIQIYNCRRIAGSSGYSVHAEGRALDVFVPMQGTDADNGKGDVIANWLIENAEHIGIQYIIWDRTRWKASGDSPRARCYTASHPHKEHIHIELSWPAARAQTSFFDSLTPPVMGSEPLPPDLWIGDRCRIDDDCNYAHNGRSGHCFLDHRPASGLGFCSVDCAGYCPDRAGKAQTFCASVAALGGEADNGVCVSRADGFNEHCAGLDGFIDLEVERYVGASGARRANAVICAPDLDDAGGGPLKPDGPLCDGDHWRCDAEGRGRFRCRDGHVDVTDDCSHGCLPGRVGEHATCAPPPGRDPVCLHTCRWAGDGECDDGGAGAQYGVCDLGTDCADCGAR